MLPAEVDALPWFRPWHPTRILGRDGMVLFTGLEGGCVLALGADEWACNFWRLGTLFTTYGEVYYLA